MGGKGNKLAFLMIWKFWQSQAGCNNLSCSFFSCPLPSLMVPSREITKEKPLERQQAITLSWSRVITLIKTLVELVNRNKWLAKEKSPNDPSAPSVLSPVRAGPGAAAPLTVQSHLPRGHSCSHTKWKKYLSSCNASPRKHCKRKPESAQELGGNNSCSHSEKFAGLSSSGQGQELDFDGPCRSLPWIFYDWGAASLHPGPTKAWPWFYFKPLSSWGNSRPTPWMNFCWSFCPVESPRLTPMLWQSWGFTRKAVGGLMTMDFTLLSIPSVLGAVETTRHCCELCKAHKSPGQTPQNLAASALDPLAPVRAAAGISPPWHQGRRSRGLFASWHRSRLSQSLQWCC